MASELVPFDEKLFRFIPSHPSKASQGLCSWHSFDYKADYAIITQDRARFAVCKLHARLFQLNRERDSIRSSFDLPESTTDSIRLVS